VPVYNGAASIGRTLDNLLAQTFVDYEILVSDNSSTDETEVICRRYADNDTRIHYVKQPRNLGPAKNFRFLVDTARGDYFLWAACDDLRSADFVELNVAFLDAHSEYVASTCPNWFEDQSSSEAVHFSMGGGLEKRFAAFFQHCWQSHAIFYSLVRTRELRYCEVLGTSFIAVDWAVNLFLASRGQVNRTEHGYTIFGRGGASQRVGAYRAFRNQRLEVILPFYSFGAYAWKLGRALPLRARVLLLGALARLNLHAVMDQSLSALYQWYGRNLKHLVRKRFP
jgi:glycosyltransferase involved in cell wall biosynthesis